MDYVENDKFASRSKKCRNCKVVKIREDFYVREKSPDGMSGDCKQCVRKNRKPPNPIADNNLKKKRDRAVKSGVLTDIKQNNPCGCCGEEEIVTLVLYQVVEGLLPFTPSLGILKIREILNGSAIVCLNCQAKIESGLIEEPSVMLKWDQYGDITDSIKMNNIWKTEKIPAPK